MTRLLLLALSLATGCAPSEPPPQPAFDDDAPPRTAVPLPDLDERRSTGSSTSTSRTSTLVAPPLLTSSAVTQTERIARRRIKVDAAGTTASLRRSGISDAIISALDDATVRRVDLQSQIPPGADIDLFLRGDILVGFHADTLIGPIWAARYDGAVSPRGWYDENGRSLSGPLRARPVDLARVTSGYGTRLHPISGSESRHTGVDYGTPVGTPVLVVGDGTVREAASSPTAGTYLKVTHAAGWESWYLHLNDLTTKKGDSVKEGQVIGHTGNTGASTGPHLHFELRIANIALDPRRTVPVPTLALSPRDLPRHATIIHQLKEIQ